MKTLSRFFPLALLVLLTSGWTTNKSIGSWSCLVTVSTTGKVFFPKAGSGLQVATNATQAQGAPFVSMARREGTGTAVFLVYSRSYPTGVDTVQVGANIYEYAKQYDCDSLDCITSPVGTIIDVEASN